MAIGKIREGLYGVIAEFNDPQTLLDAANAVREEGYTRHRRVLAVPDSRAGRGGRLPQVAPLDDRPDHGHPRRRWAASS